MAIKFLRRNWNIRSKLGKRRKKKQVWRRPTGRDNKMREKRKGRGVIVSIGYKKESQKKQIVIRNVKDLDKIHKNEIIILGGVGKKKKLEILKKAKEKKLEIYKIDIEKFLKENKKKKKIKKKEKDKSNVEGKK